MYDEIGGEVIEGVDELMVRCRLKLRKLLEDCGGIGLVATVEMVLLLVLLIVDRFELEDPLLSEDIFRSLLKAPVLLVGGLVASLWGVRQM